VSSGKVFLRKRVRSPFARLINLFLLTLGLILFTSPVIHAFDKIGTTGATFLKIGIGARATSLAGAFVSLADDPSASYWNPGGLGFQRIMAVEGGYNLWFGGIKQGYLYSVFPIGMYTTLGVGINSLSSGKIEITTLEEPEGNGLFYRYSGTVLSLAISRLLSSTFSMGIGLKGIQEVLWREEARTFALDFGALYHTEFKGLDLGLCLSNIGGRMHLEGPDLSLPVQPPGAGGAHPEIEGVLKTGNWPLPALFRVGITQELIGSRGILKDSGNSKGRLILQGTHHSEARQEASLALEYELPPWLSMRGGWKVGADEETWSIGIGVGLHWGKGMTRLDYAITNMGRLGLVNRVSLLRLF